MLKDTLYKIIFLHHHESAISATLEINKKDKIFSGHFPGHPVLPGACMIQIIKEVLELTFDASFRLKKATQIKFLAIIDPTVDNILQLKLIYDLTGRGDFDVIASLGQTDVSFKFKGVFVS